MEQYNANRHQLAASAATSEGPFGGIRDHKYMRFRLVVSLNTLGGKQYCFLEKAPQGGFVDTLLTRNNDHFRQRTRYFRK